MSGIMDVGTKIKSLAIKIQELVKKIPKALRWGILVVLILGAGLGVYAIYRNVSQAGTTVENASEMQTATARRGNLILYASGTGTLIPAREVTFGFDGNGEVVEVLVQVGEKVEAGQILARLDDTSAQEQLDQAEHNLAELTSPATVAIAQKSVVQAQQEISSKKYAYAYYVGYDVIYWEDAVEAAKTDLKKKQAAFDAESTDDNQTALSESEQVLERAERNLTHAWQTWETEFVPENFTETEVVYTYDFRGRVISEEEVVVTYVDEKTGEELPVINWPTQVLIDGAHADYDLAKARLIEAQDYYAALTGGDVSAEATGSNLEKLNQAKQSVQDAQETLENTRLYAPISGTIMSLNLNVSDRVGTASAVTIADLDRLHLDSFFDEGDWEKIVVGYEAEIVFDALPEEVYTGSVIQVDPGLSSQFNASLVHAIIELDPPQNGLDLPTGMSAAVDVISGRAENAVLVPVEALREIVSGSYAVFVIENGEARLRMVEVGVSDLIYAEIVSGLEPGEIVSTGLVETE